MNAFVIIWGIICLIFLGLAIFHIWWSFNKINEMQEPKIIQPGVIIERGMQNTDMSLKKFVLDFNKHIDGLNIANRKVNRAQAFGYLVAFITALISLIITIYGPLNFA